eukprot:543201-Prymnesium_polylepis.1
MPRVNPAQRPHPTASRSQRVPHAPWGLLHANIMRRTVHLLAACLAPILRPRPTASRAQHVPHAPR